MEDSSRGDGKIEFLIGLRSRGGTLHKAGNDRKCMWLLLLGSKESRIWPVTGQMFPANAPASELCPGRERPQRAPQTNKPSLWCPCNLMQTSARACFMVRASWARRTALKCHVGKRERDGARVRWGTNQGCLMLILVI